MNTIPSQSLMTGQSPRQDTLPDTQLSNYVNKHSVNTYESLDAGLIIRTKEGDIVTLTSNSFSKLDAFMYNSKGIIHTKSGKSESTQTKREITLTSGENFSFSVKGNLNEKELGDIEDIVKGIDEIISEMAQGDMKYAVKKAVSMDDYDTVSMYSANIRYQKSYAIASEAKVKAIQPVPANEMQPTLQEGQAANHAVPSLTELSRKNYRPLTNQNKPMATMDKFIEKMTEQLEKSNQELLDKARQAIDKLFKHYLGDIKANKDRSNKGGNVSTYKAIDNTRRQVGHLIDQIAGKTFKNYFAAFPE